MFYPVASRVHFLSPQLRLLVDKPREYYSYSNNDTNLEIINLKNPMIKIPISLLVDLWLVYNGKSMKSLWKMLENRWASCENVGGSPFLHVLFFEHGGSTGYPVPHGTPNQRFLRATLRIRLIYSGKQMSHADSVFVAKKRHDPKLYKLNDN